MNRSGIMDKFEKEFMGFVNNPPRYLNPSDIDHYVKGTMIVTYQDENITVYHAEIITKDGKRYLVSKPMLSRTLYGPEGYLILVERAEDLLIIKELPS